MILTSSVGFSVGAVMGRQPFVRDERCVLIRYSYLVGACVLLGVVSTAVPGHWISMAAAVVWIIAASALTAGSLALVMYFIGDGLWHRRQRQKEPIACRACGYCLHGNESGVCPECGVRLTGEQRDYILAETRFRKAIKPFEQADQRGD